MCFESLQVGDLSIHDSLAVFTAMLIARYCFSLQDFVYHVALPSLMAVVCPGMSLSTVSLFLFQVDEALLSV